MSYYAFEKMRGFCEKMRGSISRRGGNATRLLPKKVVRELLDTFRGITTDLAWTEDRATQRCDPSAGLGAKTGVRAELRRSVPLLSCPLRDWPQGDKPSRHDAATRRTRCPNLPETRHDTDARPWPRCNAAMPAPHPATPNDVQDRTNPAIDRARPGTTGSAKVVPSLTAADISRQ